MDNTKIFAQKKKQSTFRPLNPDRKSAPQIIMSKNSLLWIRAMVDNHDTEVGWYATVDEIEPYKFYVRDVYYPKHKEANGGTCVISSEGEDDLVRLLCESGKGEDVDKMRFWGHKHPHGTSASTQDEEQAVQRVNDTQTYLIRAICDKTEMSISFFDFKNNVRFDDLAWVAEEDIDGVEAASQVEAIRNILSNATNTTDPKSIIAAIQAHLSDEGKFNSIVQQVLSLKTLNIPQDKFPRMNVHDFGRTTYHGGYNNTGHTSPNGGNTSPNVGRTPHDDRWDEDFMCLGRGSQENSASDMYYQTNKTPPVVQGSLFPNHKDKAFNWKKFKKDQREVERLIRLKKVNGIETNSISVTPVLRMIEGKEQLVYLVNGEVVSRENLRKVINEASKRADDTKTRVDDIGGLQQLTMQTPTAETAASPGVVPKDDNILGSSRFEGDI